MIRGLEQTAKLLATRVHQGQFRKDGRTPYIVHPAGVVTLLRKYGFSDEHTLATAWLHDTLEDTTLTYDEILETCGNDVANGVFILTRNVDRDLYKARISSASQSVQAIKVCDTLDNVKTLSRLSPQGIQTKLDDCTTFYIPLAVRICKPLADALEQTIWAYQAQHA